jgi:HEPN domain-containing protein
MERSSDWIFEAERDLDHARHDVASGFFNWACFSAQQGAEKALKAVFQKLGAEAWGHSVVGLVNELQAKVNIPQELIEACQDLDKAYIPTRYPDALPSGSPSLLYNKTEAERLINYGEQVVRFCKDILSGS